jgi:ankyrin repeat protein
MGLTPFLIAAGVGTGGRGTGLAASTSAGGPPSKEIMDLLLDHGADVNAQVTDTKTYSLRISRAPSATEGMTALHVAAQAGRADEVKYLLEKGAKTDLADSNGRKPIDLAGTGILQPAAAGGVVTAAEIRSPSAATAAEIRSLLENAASQK